MKVSTQYIGFTQKGRSIVDEAQRIAYLKHMGYQQYYSRYVLAGAKASVIPATVEYVHDPEDHQQLPSKTRRADPPLRALEEKPMIGVGRRYSVVAAEEVSNRHRRGRGPAGAETGKVEAGNEQMRSGELRFSVQFIRVNAVLAVINEAPHEAGGRENQQATSLLANLLAALGIGQEELAGLTADIFNWPIAEGLGAKGDSRHAAKLALNGFIAQRHDRQGFPNLLLLTAQLVDLMSDHSEQPDMGDQNLADAPFKLTITHSLHAMLAHSDLKREAWQHMKALRKRLQSA